MNPPQAEEFWRFSLDLYARPAVAAQCLALQDGEGREVNILLLALYAGLVLGRGLAAADFAALESATAAWRDNVVVPLRAARRGLKPWSADPAAAVLRAAVQDVELGAERLAQLHLLEVLPAGLADAPGAALARTNLLAYAGTAAEPLAVAALGHTNGREG
jgi:uncharacterized protein (TIGR02444 family)